MSRCSGFRPFYLLASIFAASSEALWTAQNAGWLVRAYLGGALWHAHEMLFGFTVAVIAGFLFTHNGVPGPERAASLGRSCAVRSWACC